MFSLCDILTFSTFYLFLPVLSLSKCHFCVNKSANHLTVDELRAIFHKKLAPLKDEIAELKSFIEEANQKYSEVLTNSLNKKRSVKKSKRRTH